MDGKETADIAACSVCLGPATKKCKICGRFCDWCKEHWHDHFSDVFHTDRRNRVERYQHKLIVRNHERLERYTCSLSPTLTHRTTAPSNRVSTASEPTASYTEAEWVPVGKLPAVTSAEAIIATRVRTRTKRSNLSSTRAPRSRPLKSGTAKTRPTPRSKRRPRRKALGKQD